MLSYQHGYHAGGIADVHKHVALVLLLARLAQKPAPLCVIDSHAGRGLYDLAGEQAGKTGEWRSGIGRLAAAEPVDTGVRRYLDLVRGFNRSGALTTYPGSPALALRLMRPGDRLVLVEAHPAEHAALRAALHHDRRVHIHKRDGFEALPALVPPAERRGLVLIDPSYEIKAEYQTVPQTVDKVLLRWPAGIVAVWYPLLPDGRHAALVDGLAALPPPVLVAELTVDATSKAPDRGLIGTGLAVVNPPWTFAEALAGAGAEIAHLLFGAAGRYDQHLTGTTA